MRIRKHVNRRSARERDAAKRFTARGLACITEALVQAGQRGEPPPPIEPGYYRGDALDLYPILPLDGSLTEGVREAFTVLALAYRLPLGDVLRACHRRGEEYARVH